MIKHVVEEGRTLIGRVNSTTKTNGVGPGDHAGAGAGPQADTQALGDVRQRLLLTGLSLQSDHAMLSRTGDRVSLQALGNAQVVLRRTLPLSD